MEFEDVRAYQPGDDIRAIDWRVTARTQVTHTKRYREEQEKPVFTLVDQRSPMFFGSHPCFKSVYACHLAALLNWAALHSGDRTGGLVIGTKRYADIRPSHNHSAINRWLQQLVAFNHQLKTPTLADELTLADALRCLQRISKPGSSIFLISDYHDFNKECEQLLCRLAVHCQLNLIWVIDELEINLPLTKPLNISDGNKRLTVTPNRHFQKDFRQGYQQLQDNLLSTARKLKTSLLQAKVQTPPKELIIEAYGNQRYKKLGYSSTR